MLVAHDAMFHVVITCGLSMHGDPCSDQLVAARSLSAHLTVQSIVHGKVSGYDSGIRVKSRVSLVNPDRDLLGGGKLCPCSNCIGGPAMARTLTFRGMVLTLRERPYPNGNLAVEAMTLLGEAYATLSVNMPPYDKLPDGVFFVKEWSENADIADAFIASGLVVPADDIADRESGFIVASAYRWAD